MADEVAVFIDFENVRYGMLNQYGQEPDIGAISQKAQKYGRPTLMRAYADFTEHPSEATRRLQVAGFEAITTPVKRSVKGNVERIRNAADMILSLDAVIAALDADTNDQCKTFLLVTGDGDYVKLVTMLKNRFGQRVIICGVPGGISRDLIDAADGEDHLDVPTVAAADPVSVRSAIVAMVAAGPAPLRYWSARIIDQWSQDDRHAVPGTAKDKRDAIRALLEEGVLCQRAIDDRGREVTETFLDIGIAQQRGYTA